VKAKSRRGRVSRRDLIPDFFAAFYPVFDAWSCAKFEPVTHWCQADWLPPNARYHSWIDNPTRLPGFCRTGPRKRL